MTEATRGSTERSQRRRRAAAQLLQRPSGLGVTGAVRHLLAVQAQDRRSARLALRARIAGLTAADVDARDDLVVTWLMRGTLHLVHMDDLPWLHGLTAPTRLAANARRLRQLAVDGDGPVRAVREALPFPRAAAGEVLGLSGQAVPAVLMRASLLGLCVQDMAGMVRAAAIPPVDRGAALAELGRRYAAAHPGATDRDLATWAGLPLRDARRGMAGSPATLPPRVRVRPSPFGGGSVPPEGETGVPPRLLPAFDPYLLGWRDRSFAVPAALHARVFAGGGMFRATATVDGAVTGTWTARAGRVVLDGPDPGAFEDEVRDVERFLRATG